MNGWVDGWMDDDNEGGFISGLENSSSQGNQRVVSS